MNMNNFVWLLSDDEVNQYLGPGSAGRSPMPRGANNWSFFNQETRSNLAMPHQAHLPIVEALRALLCDDLDEVLAQLSAHKVPVVSFEQLLEVLEALPLDATEAGLAISRLANARDYVEAGEYGGAQYELRLLRGSLKQ
jgi:hypothetical protein